MRPLPIAVLLSGSGTNLQALIDAIDAGHLAATITVVVSDSSRAHGLTRARERGIPAIVVTPAEHGTREAFDSRVVEVLRAHGAELVVLAGFMRLVTRVLLGAFPDRVLNIHPALLPAFPGLHAERQALAFGARITGVTVHFVDEQTDHGPVLLQAAVPILPDDTEDSLHRRVQRQEHRLYPMAVQLIAEGRVSIDGRRVSIAGATVDGDVALANPDVPATSGR